MGITRTIMVIHMEVIILVVVLNIIEVALVAEAAEAVEANLFIAIQLALTSQELLLLGQLTYVELSMIT